MSITKNMVELDEFKNSTEIILSQKITDQQFWYFNIIDWCNENINEDKWKWCYAGYNTWNRYYVSGFEWNRKEKVCFYFEDAEDAMLFKLTWCEYK